MRVPEYEEWLVARAAQPPPGMRLGLYSGLAGVALVAWADQVLSE